MRALIIPISLLFSLLCNAAEKDFILEDSERETIQTIIDSSLRTDPWNDDISDQRSFINSHSDGDYSVRVVEIEYAPFHKTSNIKHYYQILCVIEKNIDDEWECQKYLNRSIYSSSISKWIPLLDNELNEEEAITFISKISDNKILIWEKKNVEISFDDLFNIGLSLSRDQSSIELYASHKKLGRLAIEISRNISGHITRIDGITEFFTICEDFTMEYGVEACKEN